MTTSEHDVNVADLDLVEISTPKTSGALNVFRQKINTENNELRQDLFNEAVAMDGEGNLKGAKQRFEFILNIWPEDQSARMALAHLLVSINHEKEALSLLEEPDAARTTDTAQLIDTINEKLRLSRKSESETVDSLSKRDRSELTSARRELKSLRSAQAQLVSRVHEREVELKRWVLTTASVTIAAFLFVIFTITTTAAPSKVVTPESVVSAQPEATVTEDVVAKQVEEATTQEKLTVIPVEAPATTAPDQPVEANSVDLAETEKATTVAAVAGASLNTRFPARVDGTVHTVKQDDMLWDLAYQYYGEHGHSDTLKSANGGSKDLSLGQALIIPPLPTTP